MAKQSIFGRISTLVKANVNAMLDAAEDPQKMLDQLVRDYTNSIADAESAIAETIGNLRLLERDHEEDVRAAAEWGNKALAASRKADELRASGNNVPFGFVTSEGSEEMRTVAERAGALFVIAKPFTAESFEAALSGVLK